jgi:hypothetical protein
MPQCRSTVPAHPDPITLRKNNHGRGWRACPHLLDMPRCGRQLCTCFHVRTEDAERWFQRADEGGPAEAEALALALALALAHAAVTAGHGPAQVRLVACLTCQYSDADAASHAEALRLLGAEAARTASAVNRPFHRRGAGMGCVDIPHDDWRKLAGVASGTSTSGLQKDENHGRARGKQQDGAGDHEAGFRASAVRAEGPVAAPAAADTGDQGTRAE